MQTQKIRLTSNIDYPLRPLHYSIIVVHSHGWSSTVYSMFTGSLHRKHSRVCLENYPQPSREDNNKPGLNYYPDYLSKNSLASFMAQCECCEVIDALCFRFLLCSSLSLFGCVEAVPQGSVIRFYFCFWSEIMRIDVSKSRWPVEL